MDPEHWRLIDELFQQAVELPENERGDLLVRACGEDALLRAEIEKLIDGLDRSGNFLETPPALDETTRALPESDEEPVTGLRLGVYEVIGQIGRGGMGTVYLAARADEEFRKRVAIKVVTAGFDHESIILRFRNERQILAGLDHPNIARLIDGGTTEGGAPYFVMEYIEGETIREYCNNHRLTTIERLKLFQSVCSAVHFAHQNLVVHRDIKPGNILVTADGTAKLLDFGVAKLLSPTAHTGDVTEATSRAMTPEYASPEQARGETITTASDVYSLGVLLYELLTGHRPYSVSSRSLIEVIDAICQQEPPKPSTAVARAITSHEGGGSTVVTLTPEAISSARDTEPHRLRRELEGDLDNIILKAMRKEPQRRYASVEQFSEDIERYFQHLPVIARKDTFGYRAGKFIRRNKLGVSSAAVIVLLLAFGMAGIARQTVVANRQRANAERRFNQVRKLANLVVFDYHDKIEKLPGSTPVREKMIKDAIEYLDALSSESSDDVTLQQELASAYEKIGDVQGNPYVANLGDQSGALGSYRKSLAIREALCEANPADENRRVQLGSAYSNEGDILWAAGATDDSLMRYRRALTLFTELLTASPENPKYRYGVAVSLVRIGHAQQQMGDSRAALDSYRTMLSNDEALLSTEPANVQYRRDVAIAKMKVGDALDDLGEYRSSLSSYQQSAAIFSDLGSDVNDARSSRELALVFARLALEYANVKETETAIEFHRKAIALQSQISAADPQNMQARFDLAASYANLGDAFRVLNQHAEAAASERSAINIFEEALKKDPVPSQPRMNLGVSYQALGQILFAQGNIRAALESDQKSLSILEADPIRRGGAKYLTVGYKDIGDVYSAMRNWKAAKDSYEKSLAEWRELEHRNELSEEDKSSLNDVVQKLKKCSRRMRNGRS